MYTAFPMSKWNIENKILNNTRGVTFDDVARAVRDEHGVAAIPH